MKKDEYIGILTSGGDASGIERGYPCRDPRRYF